MTILTNDVCPKLIRNQPVINSSSDYITDVVRLKYKFWNCTSKIDIIYTRLTINNTILVETIVELIL